MLGVVSQTRVSDGNRTHDFYPNSLEHYALDYPDNQMHGRKAVFHWIATGEEELIYF